LAARARWANLEVSIKEIGKDNKLLIRDLVRYDPAIAIPLLASLLTLPILQSHCIRLEILVALAVVYCRGRKKAHIGDLIRWFSEIGKSQCVAGEDPAEDVFVSLVQDRKGDYRLLEGVWEASGFYTQRVLDVVDQMPKTEQYSQIKKNVRAMLIISDMICEKAGLYRYQLGSEKHYSAISPRILPGRNTLISRVTITFSDMSKHGITFDDIAPFSLQPQMVADLPTRQIGHSHLDCFPLIVQDNKHLIVALPSALSVAIRNHVIDFVIERGLIETFDGVLAQNYSKLFFDTPLLGGPLRAPVLWKKSGSHRWCNSYFKVDEGYLISFYFFLPSVQVHPYGGFKGMYQDDGSLTEALQTSINMLLKHFERQNSFRQGFVVLVGCGWGKAYSTEVIELDNSHWRFESISAADLVRLSWLSGIRSPQFFSKKIRAFT
jgi:hypothetical protein